MNSSTFDNLAQFEFVDGNHPLFSEVKEIMDEVLTPLYGKQESALEKISKSIDRECVVMLVNNKLVGLLIYKTNISDEFSKFDICSSIEIKTLFLKNSNNNSGKGFGSCLLNKALEYGKVVGAKSLSVTVSENKQESLAFFQRKGFKIVHTFSGKYVAGVNEYLLKYEIQYEPNCTVC